MLYLAALKSKYEAEMLEAKANFSLYMSDNNLAAIGEHSSIIDEHDKWLEKYSNAKGKYDALSNLVIEKI